MNDFDIIIIGNGASGVFASYEFTKLKSKLKILVIDKGNDIFNRVCPIKTGRVKTCIGCVPCNIMNGYGGAGTLSDGKYNITTNFGGEMHKYLGREKSIELDVEYNFDSPSSKEHKTLSTYSINSIDFSLPKYLCISPPKFVVILYLPSDNVPAPP